MRNQKVAKPSVWRAGLTATQIAQGFARVALRLLCQFGEPQPGLRELQQNQSVPLARCDAREPRALRGVVTEFVQGARALLRRGYCQKANV